MSKNSQRKLKKIPKEYHQNEIGANFEERVVKLLKKIGKRRIQTNVFIGKKNDSTFSQIDIVYGIFKKTFVECKCYTKPIPLESVAKFKEVLLQNNIPVSSGMVITNSTFTPRCYRAGLQLVDGATLKRMEIQAAGLRKRRFVILVAGIFTLSAVLYKKRNEYDFTTIDGWKKLGLTWYNKLPKAP